MKSKLLVAVLFGTLSLNIYADESNKAFWQDEESLIKYCKTEKTTNTVFSIIGKVFSAIFPEAAPEISKGVNGVSKVVDGLAYGSKCSPTGMVIEDLGHISAQISEGFRNLSGQVKDLGRRMQHDFDQLNRDINAQFARTDTMLVQIEGMIQQTDIEINETARAGMILNTRRNDIDQLNDNLQEIEKFVKVTVPDVLAAYQSATIVKSKECSFSDWLYGVPFCGVESAVFGWAVGRDQIPATARTAYALARPQNGVTGVTPVQKLNSAFMQLQGIMAKSGPFEQVTRYLSRQQGSLVELTFAAQARHGTARLNALEILQAHNDAITDMYGSLQMALLALYAMSTYTVSLSGMYPDTGLAGLTFGSMAMVNLKNAANQREAALIALNNQRNLNTYALDQTLTLYNEYLSGVISDDYNASLYGQVDLALLKQSEDQAIAAAKGSFVKQGENDQAVGILPFVQPGTSPVQAKTLYGVPDAYEPHAAYAWPWTQQCDLYIYEGVSPDYAKYRENIHKAVTGYKLTKGPEGQSLTRYMKPYGQFGNYFMTAECHTNVVKGEALNLYARPDEKTPLSYFRDADGDAGSKLQPAEYASSKAWISLYFPEVYDYQSGWKDVPIEQDNNYMETRNCTNFFTDLPGPEWQVNDLIAATPEGVFVFPISEIVQGTWWTSTKHNCTGIGTGQDSWSSFWLQDNGKYAFVWSYSNVQSPRLVAILGKMIKDSSYKDVSQPYGAVDQYVVTGTPSGSRIYFQILCSEYSQTCQQRAGSATIHIGRSELTLGLDQVKTQLNLHYQGKVN